MDSSKSYASPSHGEFLAAILDESNPANTAAFAAAILDSRDPAGAAAFAACILGEHNFNPDEPRDERGRWTTGGSNGKSEDELRKEAEKALGPTGPTPTDEDAARANANSKIFGMRKFTPKDGSTPFNAQFAGFDRNGNVLLKKASGEIVVADPNSYTGDGNNFLTELAKLGKDEGFRAGLKAMPPNVHLDSRGIAGSAADKLQWEAQVIRDIGMLSELDSGKSLLETVRGQDGRGKEITIAPTTGDNYAKGGTVHFNPDRTQGPQTQSKDRERPPFIGLGQEIYNALGNLSNKTATLLQRENDGLGFGQRLRGDYNRTIDDDARLKELTGRYSAGTSYSGWGTKPLDENVIGVDGRPLPRRRDR
jgi:hypothetical protein